VTKGNERGFMSFEVHPNINAVGLYKEVCKAITNNICGKAALTSSHNDILGAVMLNTIERFVCDVSRELDDNFGGGPDDDSKPPIFDQPTAQPAPETSDGLKTCCKRRKPETSMADYLRSASDAVAAVEKDSEQLHATISQLREELARTHKLLKLYQYLSTL